MNHLNREPLAAIDMPAPVDEPRRIPRFFGDIARDSTDAASRLRVLWRD